MSGPLAFPKAADVPIIGQPCIVVSWSPTVVLTCNCEKKGTLLIVGFNLLAVCPHCGRGFQIHGVRHDIRTGEPPHFDINIVMPQAPPNGNGKAT